LKVAPARASIGNRQSAIGNRQSAIPKTLVTD
jgi:hypothetical protein